MIIDSNDLRYWLSEVKNHIWGTIAHGDVLPEYMADYKGQLTMIDYTLKWIEQKEAENDN